VANIFKSKNPPKKIQILGQEISVHYVPYLEMENDCELLGAWNMNTRSIYISKRSSDWRYVLMHELIHAILALSGIDNSLKFVIEEQICQSIEIGLTPIIIG
jgi:Zn-dependent peptidase ImmA (M78 family)